VRSWSFALVRARNCAQKARSLGAISTFIPIRTLSIQPPCRTTSRPTFASIGERGKRRGEPSVTRVGRAPAFVERELHAYLRCGILTCGLIVRRTREGVARLASLLAATIPGQQQAALSWRAWKLIE
jgi:hypothetical protein